MLEINKVKLKKYSIILSPGINFLLGAFKLILGLVIFSPWLIINAIYYIILAIARYTTIKLYSDSMKIDKKDTTNKDKILMYGGMFLLLIGFIYLLISIRMFFRNEATIFPDYIVYAVIVISFVKLILSINEMISLKKNNNSFLVVLNSLSFVDACISIVIARCSILLIVNAEDAIWNSSIFGMIASGVAIFLGIFLIIKKHKYNQMEKKQMENKNNDLSLTIETKEYKPKNSLNAVCISLLFGAVALTVLMCCLTNPEDTTISAMQCREPVIGVLWALVTSLASYFNLIYMQKKNQINNKCMTIFIIIGSICAFLTPFTMSESPIGFSVPFFNIHRFAAIIFAVVTYVVMITILIAKRNENKPLYLIFAIILMIVGFVNVFGIVGMAGFISALMETCLILVGLTILFLSNFILQNNKIIAKQEENKKHNPRLTQVLIPLISVFIVIFGITAIPSYKVTISDINITAREIPSSEINFKEIENDYFYIYLPNDWQIRNYDEFEIYYDDVDRNSYSIKYEDTINFDTITQFRQINNFAVKSAEIITYLDKQMLILETEENGDYIYKYKFNVEDKAVTVTLTFKDQENDVHELIYKSILFK